MTGATIPARRQPLALLFEILLALGPRQHARVCTPLERQVGKCSIGAQVARVPREQHTRIATGLADRLEINQRNTRRVVQRVVTRNPRQRVRPRRVRLQRFQQVPTAQGVDLVKPDERRRLAMRASNILARQDSQRTAAVAQPQLLCTGSMAASGWARSRDRLRP
jgi:hypothetical protein